MGAVGNGSAGALDRGHRRTARTALHVGAVYDAPGLPPDLADGLHDDDPAGPAP
ncbi:hypothetical protein JOF29_001958 [Kribbella aluminosa]|uniref:Uncharacterized protein n=1 Tax=Kribbella aluminosa TaxID=416017 RepID=A0ABS4UGY5_9ACTN|nr:hypothetical protein [Kribbella aluminosa]MBP2350875.1 hypothetical protein [Kribbella aluminosa]